MWCGSMIDFDLSCVVASDRCVFGGVGRVVGVGEDVQ
jgi:hypothetical protein